MDNLYLATRGEEGAMNKRLLSTTVAPGKDSASSSLPLPVAEGGVKGESPLSLEKKQVLSYLSGMNIKLAGRIMTQSMRPLLRKQRHDLVERQRLQVLPVHPVLQPKQLSEGFSMGVFAHLNAALSEPQGRRAKVNATRPAKQRP